MRVVRGLVLALALAACSSSPPGAAPSQSSSSSATASKSASHTPAGGDWPVYHHDAARTGVASDQKALGSVRRAWTSPKLDEVAYAQPLIAGDRVFVATQGNSIYALNAATGAIEWHKDLGDPVDGGSLPCGNIDPSGVTGTPAIDVEARTLYAVAFLRAGPRHELFALNLGSGAIRWHRRIDPSGMSPTVEQQRGAVALGNGRVYVPFGGLFGDCGQYKGAVVSVRDDGSGSADQYVVPTSREAGIWTPSGPVIDRDGDVWVSTGNSESRGEFDFGNAIVRLTAALKVRDYFAPSNWLALNAGDVDLGSVNPHFLENGRVLINGKEGVAYLARREHLGHVGGQVASREICSRAFGAPTSAGDMAFVPCEDSLVGLRVSTRAIDVAWRSDGGAGPAILAAGAVWSLHDDGRLVALAPGSGRVRFDIDLGAPVTRFVSPAAAYGRLFVADGDRIEAFSLR